MSTERVSAKQTPWAVECPDHGKVYLTEKEYNDQLADADGLWICPVCGRTAKWDDENYDEASEAWAEKQRSDILDHLRKTLDEDKLQELLDEIVHDLKSKEAMDINNEGANEQFHFICVETGMTYQGLKARLLADGTS